MSFNIFEGFRRILRLVQIACIIGAVIYFFVNDPYVSTTVATTSPSAPLLISGGGCYGPDRSEYRTYEIEPGKHASVELCFRATSRASNGQMLIPVTTDGWAAEQYSEVVNQYVAERAASFRLSETDRRTLVADWKKQRRNIFLGSLGFAFGAPISLSICAAILGWIIRGFFGIPFGHDHRSKEKGASSAS